MLNKCLYLRFRKKQIKTYCYCTKKCAVIESSCCSGCPDREYKKVARMTVKKPLNKINKDNKVRQATSIPKKVKEVVWKRDNCSCVFCGKYVDMFWANSHFIKRSHQGKGIEENVFTACPECHHDFDDTPRRKDMLPIAKKHLMNKYEHWNEEMLVYKKWGN